VQRLQASGITDFGAAEIKGPPEELKGDEVLEYWREAWRGFADGLRAWPHVRAAAQEILGSEILGSESSARVNDSGT
jgi:hypothetical protein